MGALPEDDINVDDILMCRTAYLELTTLTTSLKKNMLALIRRENNVPDGAFGSAAEYVPAHIGMDVMRDFEMFCAMMADGCNIDDAARRLFASLHEKSPELPAPDLAVQGAVFAAREETTRLLSKAKNDNDRRQAFLQELGLMLDHARFYLSGSHHVRFLAADAFRELDRAIVNCMIARDQRLDARAGEILQTPEAALMQGAALWFETRNLKAAGEMLTAKISPDAPLNMLDLYAGNALLLADFFRQVDANRLECEFFYEVSAPLFKSGRDVPEAGAILRTALREALNSAYGAEGYLALSPQDAALMANPLSRAAMQALITEFENAFPLDGAEAIILPEHMKVAGKPMSPPAP